MIKKLVISISVLWVTVLHAQETFQISENLKVQQIANHVYLHISYHDLEDAPHFPANGLIYVDDGKAYVVDTPWTDEEALELIQWIKAELRTPVAAVIPTHFHIDCMGGLKVFHDDGIVSYAGELTRSIAKKQKLPVPQQGFQDSLSITPNIICYYPGGGHTKDNIVVWLPDEKVLFGGCLIKAMAWKQLGNLKDADVQAWPGTLEKVLDKFPDAEVAIPGHGRYGGLELVRHTLELSRVYFSE